MGGQFINGTMEGKGIFQFDKAAPYLSYRGEWRHGQFDGEGTLDYRDGYSYRGQWSQGQQHDQGKVLSLKEGGHGQFEMCLTPSVPRGRTVLQVGTWKRGSVVESKSARLPDIG